MTQPLSYSITSLASQDVNRKFTEAKERFASFYNNRQTTKPEHFILKNIAHVTLKSAFHLKEGIRDEEVRSALSAITFPPLQIKGEEVTVFRNTKFGNILVVLVQKTPELQKLHTDLTSLIEPCSTEENKTFEREHYTPHLSVLYNLPNSLPSFQLLLSC